MKKVITYGTYDMFHQGHYNLLKNAKALGDYLIVGVTSDDFDKNRGKLNVRDSLMKRINAVQETGFADEIIIEEYFGQKIDDIKKYNIDTFTVGSDWVGYFDYLNEYCNVVYLDRTKGISSTFLRNQDTIRLGIWGSEKIVSRFYEESKYVSGIDISYIFAEENIYMDEILKKTKLTRVNSKSQFLSSIDAVYINVPPVEQYNAIVESLNNNLHVLCEFPVILSDSELNNIKRITEDKGLIFLEGLKTAFCPAFNKMLAVAKSGIVGNIISVDANFTQVLGSQIDEQIRLASGGSMNSLGAYPLLAYVKLLGTDPKSINYFTRDDYNVDIFTKIIAEYSNSIATGIVAINAKTDGAMIVSGDKGYIHIPAPWWKTEYFEVCFENINDNRKYFYKFDGEGLRYEISEFVKCILNSTDSILLTFEEVKFISKVLYDFQHNK